MEKNEMMKTIIMFGATDEERENQKRWLQYNSEWANERNDKLQGK
jgi:hypothetical protein